MITITALHDKHQVPISIDGAATLADLQRAAEVAVQVPVHAQRWMFKGRTLKDPSETLEACGIVDGVRIMLIGRKATEEEAALSAQVTAVTATIQKSAAVVRELDLSLRQLKQGFLDAAKVAEDRERIQKAASKHAEEITQALIKLDAMSFNGLTERQEDQLRLQRKQAISLAHQTGDQADSILKELKQLAH
ncbi:hypothetical protein CAOG_03682 [Capsaspora owczarzaki ATCC 30864]|uniref:hypothetical protein n=1 Tax=Capsaspora owczarzaki (strain ATCC 30864) TaxID=595528 RepID=UPI0003526D6E|nr:hypothetical protein CAOG_03682 [Capsaspora owczarzaki ATCC 30864]|eukprot:XP_004363410.2 hypothetical protein CAOG_03682 [Capsaspora owczarzaki ATCC 30864]